ncbi:MAG TPA: glycosyltransferase 87 family protein [Candidatus Eisenbacteria bacterium]|nr:glycosyltransferase 87 family protein [Candidatus Eisenbacteria bacterium]
MIGGAQPREQAAPDSGAPPAFAPGAPFRRAVDRLLSPLSYVVLFGGVQLGLLWWLARFWPGWLIASATLALCVLILALAAVTNRWTAKMLVLLVAIGLLVACPTVVLMHDRTVRGITSVDHDGAIQAEVAMDRMLHGLPIYGVDWSKTAVAQVPWDYSKGPTNPALHHNVYFPLVPMAGIPVALVAHWLRIPYDYRQVLLIFLAIGLWAIWLLPIPPARRFAMAVALFLGPLLGLYVWAGRSDVPVVALVILGLALLARDRPVLASLVIGAAFAYKLFAAPAVPFLLAWLWLRWRSQPKGWELGRCLVALASVPVITITPFLLASPAAFLRDVVLYPGGGGADPYPISGFGLSGLLLAIQAIHPQDRFPFWAFQLVALALALAVTIPWFLRRPSAGRWLTGFAVTLFALTFFARFFNDSYLTLVLALFAACAPLGDSTLLARATAPLRAAPSWLDRGTWR